MTHGMEDAIAVIIGRAGSKGLPGKNWMPIAGEPMICHTIRDAMEAPCVTRIVVSTDGEHIAAAAESMNVEVVRRPMELSSDTATVDSAVRHAIEVAQAPNEVIVILYANVPVRPANLIDRAHDLLLTSGADSVQSYVEVGKHHPFWMSRIDECDTVHPFHENGIYRRQELPSLYLPDGGVILVRRACLMRVVAGRPHAFLGDDRRGVRTKPGEVIDVDTEIDARVAETVLLRERADYASEVIGQ